MIRVCPSDHRPSLAPITIKKIYHFNQIPSKLKAFSTMDHDQMARALKGMDLSEIADVLKRLQSTSREAESKTRVAESKAHEAEMKAAAAAAALEKAADGAAATAATAAAAAAKMAAEATEVHFERLVNLMETFHAKVRYVGILSIKLFSLTQKISVMPSQRNLYFRTRNLRTRGPACVRSSFGLSMPQFIFKFGLFPL
jgi:hypothetical protein